jgi:PAS domain S-box-containing protein
MLTDIRNQDDRPEGSRPGEAARLLQSFDWAATGLGAMALWPQSWRTIVDMMLAASVPMAVLWGRDGLMLYNDAYIPVAGSRHPAIWGGSLFDAWPEMADFSRMVMDRCFAGGEALSFHEQPFLFERDGTLEQRWLNLDYSPIRDERGQVAGVLAIVIEVTEQVQAEEALREINDSLEQRVQDALAERKLLVDIVEGAQDPIAVLDRDFRYLAFNRAYRDNVHRVMAIGAPGPGIPSPLAVGRTFEATWRDFPEAMVERRQFWARAGWRGIRDHGDRGRDRWRR